MTIDELISELETIKSRVGGDVEVLVEHYHEGVCYDMQSSVVCEWDMKNEKHVVYLQLDEDWIDEEKENSDYNSIVGMKEYMPSDMKWETISAERMMQMKDLKVLPSPRSRIILES